MALILNINTAFEKAQVALSNNGTIIGKAESNNQKNHSSFLEPAIQQISKNARINLQHIDAVAVVNGPGSYTGLRIGLSSAKALCYALNKPLILLNTLDVMADTLKHQFVTREENVLFCPLIDARRMEVYTALYNNNLRLINDYSSVIIDADFFSSGMNNNIIVAGGNGSDKLKKILKSEHLIYTDISDLSEAIIRMADNAFVKKIFSSIAYSEPFYLKPFYSPGLQ